MNKQQVLNKIEQAWTAFKESYAGLSDEQLLEPGVTEGWSIKDILAHISSWEEETLKHLPSILQGTRPARYSALYGGIDAYNALMTEKKRDLSLSEVMRQLDETHLRLIEYVKSAPDEQLVSDTRFRRRLRLDTYSHYPIHAQAIREWRERSAFS
jgi:hypothetical protein